MKLRQPSTIILAIIAFALVGVAAFVVTDGALSDDDDNQNPATATSGEQRVVLENMGMT